MTISRKALLGGVASLGAAASAETLSRAAGAGSSAVLGAWKLESFDVVEKDGTTKPRFGNNPVGYLIYTPSGRMSATLSGVKRPKFEPAAESSSACAEQLTDFLSYAGTYDIHGDRVFHRVEVSVFTNLVGTTLERKFVIAGDTLTIRTITPGMWGSDSILVWKRT
ncbi:MAG: lipocalin-like domain-containing protein [Candidatus Eremiobacteraeota bacterium]|nr:lipocalin-like domain-containing protein [Candidatus Eremiobacteraeota bacterium]